MDNTQLMQQNFCKNMLEKICNLSAVLDIGNYQLTLQELAKFCIYEISHNRIRSYIDLQSSIKEKFNFDFDNNIIESITIALEKEGSLVKNNSYLYLSQNAIKEIKYKLENLEDTEQKTKQAWFLELENSFPQLNKEKCWKSLTSYITHAFLRHGMQAASLIKEGITSQVQGVEEDDDRLNILLNKSVIEQFDRGTRDYLNVKIAISSFMNSISSNNDRIEFVTKIADGAFSYFLLAVEPDVSRHLITELRPLTIYLDTNFVFGILELHNNSQVNISKILLETIKKYKLPFTLKCKTDTIDEIKYTIKNAKKNLSSRVYSSSLSSAICTSKITTGIEDKFHERNAKARVDIHDFFRQFEHIDVILQENGIEIDNTICVDEEIKKDVCSKYRTFLESKGKGYKTYEVVMHDASLLSEARLLRTSAQSSLDAGAIILSCDYFFYRFDWMTCKNNNDKACVLLPSIFWQIIRPFIPSDIEWEKSFASTFSLPELRAIGSNSSEVAQKMIQILASYEGLKTETAIRMLSNDILLDSLCPVQDEETFCKVINEAIIDENNTLLEENARLQEYLEDKKKSIEVEISEKENAKFEANILSQKIEEKMVNLII